MCLNMSFSPSVMHAVYVHPNGARGNAIRRTPRPAIAPGRSTATTRPHASAYDAY